MKKFLKILSWLFLIFVLLIIFISTFGNDDTKDDVDVNSESISTNNVQAETENEENSENIILVDNKYIKATYKGIKYEESVDTNYLFIHFDNKTDEEITPTPTESSVDDEMIMFASGLPPTMQAHKSINAAFIIGPNAPKDNIEFKLSIRDGDFNELLLTDVIRIDYK